MDLRKIRRTVITAVASDDVLLDVLVLKGGNALDLIYKLGERASVDVDFSMEGDFADSADVERRLFRALGDRFDAQGYAVIDQKFGPRPKEPLEGRPDWGGYRAEFKIVSRENLARFGGDPQQLRRSSLAIDAEQTRTFKIDISKFEYCKPKIAREVDAYTVYVYPPDLIAAEKLRALCQQMPEYPLRGRSKPRARDFYDIHAIVTDGHVTLDSHTGYQLLKEVFAAKNVPIEWLTRIHEGREFHRTDWPSVQDSVPAGRSRDFDVYFDFVVELAKRLDAFRVV